MEDTLTQTYSRIANHQVQLSVVSAQDETVTDLFTWQGEAMIFPDEPKVSDACKDLMRKLLTRRRDRLGCGKAGVQALKDHAFFQSLNWDTLRDSTPPMVPDLTGPSDSSGLRCPPSFPIIQNFKFFRNMCSDFLAYRFSIRPCLSSSLFPASRSFANCFSILTNPSYLLCLLLRFASPCNFVMASYDFLKI